jgi:hypothetical protein
MAVKINSGAVAAKQPSWLMYGSESKDALKQAVHKQQEAKEAASRMRRFYLNDGEEKTVTFLDGILDKEGVLEFLSYHEHNLQTGPKSWEQIPCIARSEICPLCNIGDTPRYVGVLTVINHTQYTIKQGPNAGKVLGDRRELYVATANTLNMLQHHAAKRGGLRGWKVEIARIGDKSARVGSTFQWLEQLNDAALAALGELGQPADYAHEIRAYTAAEMVKAGFGKPATGPGLSGGVDSAKDEM